MKDKYTVGWGKPPKHGQFKPGTSGNLAGRPKGSKNLRTDLEQEMSERIQVTEGGKSITVTKRRAVLKRITNKAMNGETAAARVLFNLMVGLEQVDVQDKQAEPLEEEDLEILAEFKKRFTRNHNDEGESS
jgi:hypothetical protein